MKIKLIIVVLVSAFLSGCSSSSNVPDIKAHAAETWRQAGFEIIGYEGYENSYWFGSDYGGGYVWHTLRRSKDNGIIYHGFIQKWGNEYHIYNISAIDAIKPAE